MGAFSGVLKFSGGRMVACVLVLLCAFSLTPLFAADIVVLATHEAKLNLDGSVLGTFQPFTPVRVKDINLGNHKLYAKSSLSGELLIFKFEMRKETESTLHFRAEFTPPRRATLAIPGSAVNGQTSIASKKNGRHNRRQTKVGEAHSAQESKKVGNRLVINSKRAIQMNANGKLKKTFAAKEIKELHKMAFGYHKIYLRSLETMELAVFDIEFPQGATRTITITPKYSDGPAKGEFPRRRKAGLRAVEVARQLFGKPAVSTPQLALKPDIKNEIVLTLSQLSVVTAKDSTAGGSQ